MSLVEAQGQILRTHPVEIQRIGNAHRDPTWRPLTEDEASLASDIQSGSDYFAAAGLESPLYYWK